MLRITELKLPINHAEADLADALVARLEIKPETFNVDEIIASAIKSVAPLAEGQSISLELDIADDLGAAYSDRQRLRQCLVSVLSNACRLAPGGMVKLRAHRQTTPTGDLLRFEVSDTGAAMTEAQLAHAFEPFVAPDLRGAHRLGGAGLGLAITRKLIGLLGGTIQATSTQGQGSIFVLTAPVLVDDAAGAAQNAA